MEKGHDFLKPLEPPTRGHSKSLDYRDDFLRHQLWWREWPRAQDTEALQLLSLTFEHLMW